MVLESLGVTERFFSHQWLRSFYQTSRRPTATAPGAQMARRALSFDRGLRYHLFCVHGTTCLTWNGASC